ncbi:MAG: universal stress protein [Chloroflexi bacterium]|nr:universal stress protein [Chloroflexota bacterium]
MTNINPRTYHAALEDFYKARRQAALQELLARFTGANTQLLSYDEIRQQFQLTNVRDRGLEEIPLDKIVGSVGRYQDFTRNFLPKSDSNKERWARVKATQEDLAGLPPIEVYQVGDAYFVIDGNHRVSVARRLKMPTISAYVTEVKTRVPLEADDDPNEIICKARYAAFLEQTNLDKLRPDANLLMTFCGHYHMLLEHIAVHRHFLGLEQQREIPYEEAVASWYDHVYLPVVQMVREQGVLRYFPRRTEADMYVLLAEYRAELAQALDWDVSLETAVTELTQQQRTPLQAAAEAGGKLLDAIAPDALEGGPPPGQWRLERMSKRPSQRLFDDLLVAIGSRPSDWRALDAGIQIAQRGRSRLLGLHVTPDDAEEELDDAALQAEFERRCAEAGVEGHFALDRGPVARTIVARSIYVDAVIIPLNAPPGESVRERYVSGLQYILRHTPRPILTVPQQTTSTFNHALLAYGGHPAVREEALFVAAYLAARYQIGLTVLSVGEKAETAELLAQARTYLQEFEAPAEFVARSGPVEEAIVSTAVSVNADFLIVGSFAYSPLRTLLKGSTINRLFLQDYPNPILICR